MWCIHITSQLSAWTMPLSACHLSSQHTRRPTSYTHAKMQSDAHTSHFAASTLLADTCSQPVLSSKTARVHYGCMQNHSLVHAMNWRILRPWSQCRPSLSLIIELSPRVSICCPRVSRLQLHRLPLQLCLIKETPNWGGLGGMDMSAGC